MNIRVLCPEDIDAYKNLRLEGIEESPSSFWASYAEESNCPLEQMQNRLVATPHQVIFGVFDNGQLIAMAGFRREQIAKIEHRGNIWGVYVSPASRGLGIARQLLDSLLSHAKNIPNVIQVTLGVRTTNSAAKALYLQLGFVPTGIDRRSICIDGQFHDEERMALFFDQ